MSVLPLDMSVMMYGDVVVASMMSSMVTRTSCSRRDRGPRVRARRPQGFFPLFQRPRRLHSMMWWSDDGGDSPDDVVDVSLERWNARRVETRGSSMSWMHTDLWLESRAGSDHPNHLNLWMGDLHGHFEYEPVLRQGCQVVYFSTRFLKSGFFWNRLVDCFSIWCTCIQLIFAKKAKNLVFFGIFWFALGNTFQNLRNLWNFK